MVLNLETSSIPSLDLPTKNPNSTRDINESLLDIGEIPTSQNAEKSVTSLQMSPSVVKSILLELAGGLSVELSTTAEKSVSTTVMKSTTSPKKIVPTNVESMPMSMRTLVPSISFNFKKRTEKLAITKKESPSVPTKSVENSAIIIEKPSTDIELAMGGWRSSEDDMR